MNKPLLYVCFFLLLIIGYGCNKKNTQVITTPSNYVKANVTGSASRNPIHHINSIVQKNKMGHFNINSRLVYIDSWPHITAGVNDCHTNLHIDSVVVYITNNQITFATHIWDPILI